MRRLARHTMPALLLAAALAALGCTGDSEQAATTATASPSATATPTATATAVPTSTTTTRRSLTTSATGSGRINPLPGTYSYLDGDTVTVTATPDEGWRLASWGGDCSGTATACVLTMDANKTANVTFELPVRTLTVTVTGLGGEVTPAGATEQDANAEVTLTASWNDATHSFTGWTGDCVATTSACVVTMDADKAVTATFAALSATRCATPTAADCIRAVYQGAPDDYAQVADVPADKLLTPSTSGHYHVERGQQYTVVTAATLPSTGGWTRFYLQRDPGPTFGVPSPVSFSQLIKPIGTTYTFTVSTETGAPTNGGYPLTFTNDLPAQFSYDLRAARPFVRPRPDGKPRLGGVVVRATFRTSKFEYNSFDSTGAASTVGSYGFLKPNADSDVEGATEPATTYEELREDAVEIVVNVTDGDEGTLAGFYRDLEEGDLVEWREDSDCWGRYMVTGSATGTGSVRNVPVRPYAYQPAGCTGTVTSTAVQFDWDPPDIPASAITNPVYFGGYLLATGRSPRPLPAQENLELPAPVPSGTTVHPLWRQPDVPDDWVQFAFSWGDPYLSPEWGYSEGYRDAEGRYALGIWGRKVAREPRYIVGEGYYEARVIDGYLVVAAFSPAYATYEHKRSSRVWVYDLDTGVEYEVEGWFYRDSPDRTIAIALSIMTGVQ